MITLGTSVKMPNKEKSVKTVPNGETGADAIKTDVISTDGRKGANNKKKDKHKTKEADKLNNIVSNDDEIRAVGEELLKRLQHNGTTISVRKTDGSSEMQQLLGSTSTSVNKSKQLNNNNSKAHNKNCQIVSTEPVNSSPNHVEISSEESLVVQYNGIHASNSSQIATTTSKETPPENASLQLCNDLPSTSTATPNECALAKSALSIKSIKTDNVEVTFKEYENELQMPDIMRVIQRELSEPYSIYTYRYFIHNWPKLCFLAMDGVNCIGAIVCKLDVHRQTTKRGYIAMLAVDAAYRKLKVGTTLVQKAIEVNFIDTVNFVPTTLNRHLFFYFRRCSNTMQTKWC